MKLRRFVRKYGLWILVLLIIPVLILVFRNVQFPVKVEATPTARRVSTNTPVPDVSCDPVTVRNDTGTAMVLLVDGSEIYLGKYTEIELYPYEYCPGKGGHSIVLINGQVAIRSQQQVQGKTIFVTNPRGILATVEGNALVNYDANGGNFRVDCSNGNCALGVDANNMNQLTCGESGVIDAYLIFQGPVQLDPFALLAYGDWLASPCVSLPTETPTPTPNQTATAFCSEFSGQFPLTPCPDQTP